MCREEEEQLHPCSASRVSRQALAGIWRLCLRAGSTDGRIDTPAAAGELCQLPGGAPGEGISMEGSPGSGLTSLISASFQRLLQSLGRKGGLHSWMPLFKYLKDFPTYHVSCLMNDFFISSLNSSLLLLSLSIPVDLINAPLHVLQGKEWLWW